MTRFTTTEHIEAPPDACSVRKIYLRLSKIPLAYSRSVPRSVFQGHLTRNTCLEHPEPIDETITFGLKKRSMRGSTGHQSALKSREQVSNDGFHFVDLAQVASDCTTIRLVASTAVLDKRCLLA